MIPAMYPAAGGSGDLWIAIPGAFAIVGVVTTIVFIVDYWLERRKR